MNVIQFRRLPACNISRNPGKPLSLWYSKHYCLRFLSPTHWHDLETVPDNQSHRTTATWTPKTSYGYIYGTLFMILIYIDIMFCFSHFVQKWCIVLKMSAVKHVLYTIQLSHDLTLFGRVRLSLHLFKEHKDFLSFLKTEMTQVVEIPPFGRNRPVYTTWSMPLLLMTYWCKEPRHQQPWGNQNILGELGQHQWCWPNSPRIFWFPKGYYDTLFQPCMC